MRNLIVFMEVLALTLLGSIAITGSLMADTQEVQPVGVSTDIRYFDANSIGIGTTTPGSAAGASPLLQIYGSTPGFVTKLSSEDKQFAFINASNGAYIDSTGSSGVTNNSIIFRLSDTASTHSFVEKVKISAGTDNVFQINMRVGDTHGGPLRLYNPTSPALDIGSIMVHIANAATYPTIDNRQQGLAGAFWIDNTATEAKYQIATKLDDGQTTTLTEAGSLILSGVGTRGATTRQLAVGMGTLSPGEPLHIIANVAGGGIRLERTAATTGRYSLAVQSTGDFSIDETGIANRIYIKKTSGNIGFGTTNPGGGAGSSVLTVANSSAVPTSVANTTHLYSRNGEGYWMDAAGNATLQTPHDPVTGEWIFYSKNVKTGRIVRVDMERLVKVVEKLTGEKFMMEEYESR